MPDALSTVVAGLVFVQPDERDVVVSAVQEKEYRDIALEPGLPTPVFDQRYSISRELLSPGYN